MSKCVRWITCLFFLFLVVQWALHDPPDILTLGTPDTDEEILDDGDNVRARLSLPTNTHWPTPNTDCALQADIFSDAGLALPGRLLTSTDPSTPQSPATLDRITRLPPAA